MTTDLDECRKKFEETFPSANKHRSDDQYSGEYADIWEGWQLCFELHEQDRRDAAAFRYLDEHGSRHGGGSGETFTCFIPVDHEDLACAIHAAIAKEQGDK